MTEIQNKAIAHLSRFANVTCIEEMEGFKDNNQSTPLEAVAEVTCFDGDDYYFRYNIWENGDTDIYRFKLEDKSKMRYDDRFSLFRNKYDEPDNKQSDVVVENKIKIEKEFKKMARCDFAKIAQEVNRERFKSWVEDNADDLVTYAEDVFTESYGTYMDDNSDEYADLAHDAIDNIIDNLWMGDYTSEVEDAEEVVADVIM